MPISEGKFLDLKKSSKTRKKNAVPNITRKFSIKNFHPLNMNSMKKEELEKLNSQKKIPIISSSHSAHEKSENNPIFQKLELDNGVKLT